MSSLLTQKWSFKSDLRPIFWLYFFEFIFQFFCFLNLFSILEFIPLAIILFKKTTFPLEFSFVSYGYLCVAKDIYSFFFYFLCSKGEGCLLSLCSYIPDYWDIPLLLNPSLATPNCSFHFISIFIFITARTSTSEGSCDETNIFIPIF